MLPSGTLLLQPLGGTVNDDAQLASLPMQYCFTETHLADAS